MIKFNVSKFSIALIAVILASCASQPTQQSNEPNPVTTKQPASQKSITLTSNQQNQLFKAVDHLHNNEIKQAEQKENNTHKEDEPIFTPLPLSEDIIS